MDIYSKLLLSLGGTWYYSINYYICQQSVFQVLEQCEDVLRRLDLTCNYRLRPLLITIVCRFLFTFMHTSLSFKFICDASLNGILKCGQIFLTLFLSHMIEVQFFTMLFLLRTIYKTINSGIVPGATRKHLESLIKCHHLISGVTNDLDSTYSLQVYNIHFSM